MLGEINCAHIVAMIIQARKGALLFHDWFVFLRLFDSIDEVIVKLLESPNFYGCVVGTRDEGIGLFNVLNLIYPVHMTIKVRQQPLTGFSFAFLPERD